MQIEVWPIDRLKDYPKNARKWSAQARSPSHPALATSISLTQRRIARRAAQLYRRFPQRVRFRKRCSVMIAIR